jgi:hypothetical protein
MFRNVATGEVRRATAHAQNAARDMVPDAFDKAAWPVWECWGGGECYWHMTLAGDCVGGPRPVVAASPPAVDPLQVAIEALRSIYSGSAVTGRWIDADGEAHGHDEAEPDEGCYNRDAPPDGYDTDGYCGFDDDRPDPAGGEELIPVDWEAYTRADQTDWLDSCASLARAALVKMGVPVAIEGEG